MRKKVIDKEAFKQSVRDNVRSQFRKTIDEATPAQVFHAVAYAVKDTIIDKWIATHKEYEKQDAKTVYYLSMEFLMGRALGNNMINIGAYKAGSNPGIDYAIQKIQEVNEFLMQEVNEKFTFEDTLVLLRGIFDEGPKD